MRPSISLVYESSPGCAAAPLVRPYRRRRPERTVLYQTLQHHLETFLARARDPDGEGHGPPWFVEKELRGYLACGILAHGFARVRCDACHHEHLVAFSCKGRGVCPSCAGRRMHDTATHLVDRVLPRAPIRQWVLAFPAWARPALAYHPTLLGETLTRFIRALFTFQRRRARELGLPTTRARTSGAITFVQRFGSALQLTPHFHVLVPDGVFVHEAARIRFHRVPPPDDNEVAALLTKAVRAVVKLMRGRGVVGAGEPPRSCDGEDRTPDWLERVATEATHLPRKSASGRAPIDPGPLPLTARVDGFSLHADRVVADNDRQGLEQLCRYGLRPAVSAERLHLAQDGRLVYHLKRTFSDGTNQVVFTPDALLRRLVALIPRPRVHLVRYHGIFAPRAQGRARGHPGPVEAPTAPTIPAPVDREPLEAHDPWPSAPLRPRRLPWAELLRRVHQVDVQTCANCRGPVRILAFLTDPKVTMAILQCLGLPSTPPSLTPARAPPQTKLAFDDDLA